MVIRRWKELPPDDRKVVAGLAVVLVITLAQTACLLWLAVNA